MTGNVSAVPAWNTSALPCSNYDYKLETCCSPAGADEWRAAQSLIRKSLEHNDNETTPNSSTTKFCGPLPKRGCIYNKNYGIFTPVSADTATLLIVLLLSTVTVSSTR